MMEHRNSSRENIVLVTGNKDHKVLTDKGRDGSSDFESSATRLSPKTGKSAIDCKGYGC